MEGKTKFQGLKGEQGFTLIELIMVIVILGILAATAMPKYFDMREDARIAAVEGLAGSIAGASSIAHAACIMDTTTPCSVSAASSSTVLGGATIAMVYGYPAATIAGIQTAMDYTAGQFRTTIVAPIITYHLTTLANAGCEVDYTAATDATTPSITAAIKTTCNF